MISVHVLWHIRSDDKDGDNPKLIGVYRTDSDARAAIARLVDKPGFCDHPNGFEVAEYPLNKDHWEEGFIGGDNLDGPISREPVH